MSDYPLATLRGGPLDGQQRQVIGIGYVQPCLLPKHRGFADARYRWDANLTKLGRWDWYGEFVGYFSGRQELRKDGSRMPRRKKA